MTKSQLGPDLETRLYDYIQVDKINQLYNQITERVEKSLSKKQDSEKSQGMKGEGGLGELITQLGLKLSVSGDTQSKHAVSEEATYELSPEHKLRGLWRHLYQAGLLSDLNECVRRNSDISPSITLVKFEGTKACFTLVEPQSNPHDDHTLIRVHCDVEGYAAEFFCSRGYFQGSALLYDIQESVTRDISGVASMKSIDHLRKRIALNPLAF